MKSKKIVFIQGLGVIGSINAFCISYKYPKYKIIGFEANNDTGNKIIQKIDKGQFPFISNDLKLKPIVKLVSKKKKFTRNK